MSKEAVYLKIAGFIKSKVIDNVYKPNEKIPTEAELAYQFNTSRTTVVKALDKLNTEGVIYRIQGSGSFITDIPLHLEMPPMISLIFPFIHSDSTRIDEINIIRGVENHLKSVGYLLTIHYVKNDMNDENEMIKYCKNHVSQGVILYPINAKREMGAVFDLVLDPFPIVFLDKMADIGNIACVCTDNIKGGYKATKYLISKKYNDFYFLSDGDIEALPASKERYFGYCKALRENGFKIDDRHCMSGFGVKNGIYEPVIYKNNPEVYQNIIKSILKMNDSKGNIGIVAKQDLEAMNTACAAIDLGIKIPEFMGIMGYDNSSFATQSPIPLSTITQDYYNIGIKSAQILVDMIETKKKIYSCYSFEPKLLIRNSTR